LVVAGLAFSATNVFVTSPGPRRRYGCCRSEGRCLLVAEGALVHPQLDASEWVFDNLAAAVENRRPRFEALGHAIENVLVFDTKNRADVVRASRAQLASAAGFRVAVVDPFEITQLAAADRRYLFRLVWLPVVPAMSEKPIFRARKG
jgi:hypothetical protein